MEREAAEFFQARVLSVAGTSVKVQTAGEGEPVTVSRSDAMRVPRGSAGRPEIGPAVCNDARTEWRPCLILRHQASESVVRLPSGEERQLPWSRVLTPTPVTALNVSRLFEQIGERRRFLETARRAGDPVAPRGWTPEVREPVLARRGEEWFSAHVDSREGDGGFLVRWEGQAGAEAVSAQNVVPVPPFPQRATPGQFVLVAPPNPAGPWSKARVEATGPDQAVVVDGAGQRSRVSVREVVPLGAP